MSGLSTKCTDSVNIKCRKSNMHLHLEMETSKPQRILPAEATHGYNKSALLTIARFTMHYSYFPSLLSLSSET